MSASSSNIISSAVCAAWQEAQLLLSLALTATECIKDLNLSQLHCGQRHISVTAIDGA